MARLALALHQAGRDPREVMRDCYGVDFPDEFFVLAETMPRLMFDYTIRPWALARTLDRGGPPQGDDLMDALDSRVAARDPDLLALGLCLGEDLDPVDEQDDDYTGVGGQYLCYRLSELAAGRSTIFSVDFRAKPEDPITPRGPSLMTVLHKHLVANALWVERERRRTAAHSGGGLDNDDVLDARQIVDQLETLRRRLGWRGGP